MRRFLSIVLLVILLAGCAPNWESAIDAPIYHVAITGSDANAGSQDAPWASLQKAMSIAAKDSIIFVHAGTYFPSGADFKNDGVTVTNAPGEQVIIQLRDSNQQAFNCWTSVGNGAKTGIRVIGRDVTPAKLPNGAISQKGIVILGKVGATWAAFLPEARCDGWEVAGVDFVDVGHAIFTRKTTKGRTGDWSADGWKVHDNRVYGFYKETGMQFNGNDNTVENNEIWKLTPQLSTPYGCYLLNLLGHGNTVRGNRLIGTGGTECSGVLFEWSQADNNVLENNTISGVKNGFEFQGGDNNLLRWNIVQASGQKYSIQNYPASRTTWPCDDRAGGSAAALVPPNDPTHPDYAYYYPYGECESRNNTIVDGPMPTSAPTASLTASPLPTATSTSSPLPSSTPTLEYTATATPRPTRTPECLWFENVSGFVCVP